MADPENQELEMPASPVCFPCLLSVPGVIVGVFYDGDDALGMACVTVPVLGDRFWPGRA